jgi:hypothetical protein
MSVKCPGETGQGDSSMDEKAQVLATIRLLAAVGEAIKEQSPVPTGVLYAAVMPMFSRHTFQIILDILKNAQLIEERNNQLRWIGDDAATENFRKATKGGRQ